VPLVLSGGVAALAALGLAAFGARLEPSPGPQDSPGPISA